MAALQRRLSLPALVWVVSNLWVSSGIAQNLTPRAYWPAPRGTRILTLGYNYTSGDIVTDPSLPVVGVDSSINLGLLAYVQTLNLFGRSSNLILELPYSWGTTRGDVREAASRVDFSGLADIAATLSINLMGAPSLTPEDFQELRRRPRQMLGASIKVVAPTGDYDPTRVINIGTNRWAVKGELGYMIPIEPRWLLEFQLGGWIIGDNDDFLGVTREQAPIATSEFHLVRRFRPGFWGSLDLNYYAGGRSTIDGVEAGDLQRNSRVGGTIVVPIRRRYAVKVGYSTGLVTASGGDFEMLLLSFTAIFR